MAEKFGWASGTGHYIAGYLLLQIAGGTLADRFGAKWYSVPACYSGRCSLFGMFYYLRNANSDK